MTTAVRRLAATPVVLVFMLSACSARSEAGCAAASETANAALAEASEAAERMQGVAAEPIEPRAPSSFPSPTDTEGFYLSQESQANIANSQARQEAQRRVDAERREHAEEGRRRLERYTIIVEQNPDCFDVDTRARAEQLARQLQTGAAD